MRLDSVAQAALNALYDQMWLYYNLFQLVMRLREKARTTHRIVRRWDTAQSPLERLLATKMLAEEQCQRLAHLHTTANPRALRQQIYQDLVRLLGQPTAPIAWEEVG
jgi:hypothetical protein